TRPPDVGARDRGYLVSTQSRFAARRRYWSRLPIQRMSVLSQRAPSVWQLPRAPRKWAQTHASRRPTVHLLQERRRWVTPPMAPSRDCRRSCIWPCAPPAVWEFQDLVCSSLRSLFPLIILDLLNTHLDT